MYVENQLGAKRAVEESWEEVLKSCGVFNVYIVIT